MVSTWCAALRSSMASMGCQPDMESGLKADHVLPVEMRIRENGWFQKMFRSRMIWDVEMTIDMFTEQ